MTGERFNLASWFVDRHVAEGRGDRVALYCGERRVTYAELSVEVARVGNVLRELGVRQEERVLLALRDGVEFVASWYAAQKLGAVTAEVYTFLPAKDLAYFLNYTRAGVVIVDTSTLAAVREAREMLGPDSPWPRALLVAGARPEELLGGEGSYDELVAQASGELDPAPTRPDDIALWKFTTGSTGMPKACVHRTVTPYLSFHAYARGVLDIREDDIVLPVPKLFFGYARDLAALYPFGAGGAGIVFPERPTPELLFELAGRFKPTILVNVPTMIRAMLEAPSDLSSLRLCTSAGEALPVALHERWTSRFGVELLDGIGSSEAYHIYISSRPGRVQPGRLGEVVPGYRARVVDESGLEVADGETGRLWVSGETTALMYWDAREKSVETYAGDTVMSGDLFARHADGFFEYRGRADDMLKVGGIWVAPQEIERCLTGHPDVADCAVVGYLEDGLELPRAFVMLRSGAVADPAALQSFVKGALSPHKYPRDVRFVDELPRTGSGKVDRRALRERAD
ncbi:MAG TPA: benzoate-CoA ligase family protein [Solirubrobacteraceae bacterium]|jgi:benzoate-CoA ligase family protein|nr:benzoate-CoA ligase family protein [Solirubrobacteraceae bacterium]